MTNQSTDDTERFDEIEYVGPDELLDTWQSHFERLMDGRWPDDSVSLEWDTTDDEAVLRIEEPPEDAVTVEWCGSTCRSISVYFSRAIDAAQESGRFVCEQDNPIGRGDRKHTAMVAVPVTDNRQQIMEAMG